MSTVITPPREAAPPISLSRPVAVPARIAGLDELRGLSILWVMVCHGTTLWTWMPPEFGGYGFHGVVLFFVISGYLITKILIDAPKGEGYLSRFYINRLFRIWPLMLVALVVSALAWPSQARMAVFNLLMINNYAYAYGIEPMVRTDVMWSLAVEEQFYFLWPIVLFFCRGRAVAWVAASVLFLGLCFDAALLPRGDGIIFKTTHGNMQYIAMGALVAVGPKGLRFFLGAWGAFAACWLAAKGLMPGLASFRWIWWGISFALGLLVHLTVHWRPLVLFKPLAELGQLCFGVYIIHFFISWLTLKHFGRGVMLPGAIYMVVSTILAVLSFRYFERPILQSRVKILASPRLQLMTFSALGVAALISVISLIPIIKHYPWPGK